MIVRDILAPALLDAAADAGVAPGALAVFVVDARRPRGTTPLAYLQPAGVVRRDTVAVFRAAGAGRVGALHLRAHRLALWGELPGIPAAALGPMLRHELEHARRFERSGPSFFAADERLRASVARAGGSDYTALPSEREANAAAAAYARSRLGARELESVAGCAECSGLLTPVPTPDDVVEATLDGLRARAGAAVGAGLEAYLDEVRRACAAWGRGRGLDLAGGRPGPSIELVAPVSAGTGIVWGEP